MIKGLRSIKEVVYKLMRILNTEQKRYGILVLITSFLGALFEMFGVSIIIPLVNSLIEPEQLLQDKFFGRFFKSYNIIDRNQIVLVVGFGTIILYLAKNVFFVFLSWVRAKFSSKVQRELSVQMIKSYMNKGYSFFLKGNSGEMIRSVNGDAKGVYALLNQSFKCIIESMTIVMICIFILVTDWFMAIGIIILALSCLTIIYGCFKEKLRKQGKLSRSYNAKLNQQTIQIFQGIKEIIVQRKQKFFVKIFEDTNIAQQRAMVWSAVGTESPAYIIEAICITGLLGIICIRISSGQANTSVMIPSLSAFAVGAFRILPALGRISSGINSIIFYIPSLNNMYEKFDSMSDENNIDIQCVADTGITGLVNEFTLKQISWKYQIGENNILNNISLTIKKGDSIAIIGKSGAGKTTLADIMLGLLKPQIGEVLLDGTDIFTIGKEWEHIMGYVPQMVYITDDSLRKNIAFGLNDEEIDDNKVWKALEKAQLKQYVLGLEKQLDTIVGERGIRFSGGQRQRVAIARALYEEPDILILDEATAALDNETENIVMEAIEHLQGKITLIIIAHRLNTIRNCDRIYEVEDGKVWERDKAEFFHDKRSIV